MTDDAPDIADQVDSSTKNKPISRNELARFIKKLADLYSDKAWGDPRLAAGLEELARELKGRVKASETQSPPPFYSDDKMKSLTPDEARKFIDHAGTKSDLVRFARIRLSIPHSRLQKMRIVDLVENLKMALRHEDSLTIIAQQAERGGEGRRS